MKKKKSVLKIVLEILIPLALVAALVIFVGIPLYATEEEEPIDPPTISYYEGDAAPLTMENDDLLFEMDPKTTQFKVTEKATGREWYSNPLDAASDPVALAANKELLQATAVVTYSSSTGTIDMNNYAYSIQDGTYTVEQNEDGSISVHYSVGDIEKIYIIPTAITQERFESFTSQMKSSTARRVANMYTLYQPDKLDSVKDKDTLLEMYPSLADQALYVLRDGVSANNKASAEGFLAEAGYTQEDYEQDMQLVAGAATQIKPVFNVTLTYRLDGGDFLVEVPYDQIRYRAEYPITYVTVLPMFGAAGTEESGCIFVPEGGGAVINYNNGKLSQNSYYANMYGWDYASDRTEVVSETKNSFPVFGMARTGGGSFICIMEGASSYGGVQADISGRYNSYNTVSAKYNVLHADSYNVSVKTARLVYMFEKEIPDDTIVQRYRFIDSDSYVDMANTYGAYLREKYPSLQANDVSEDMPVLVELLGAIDKKVVKFGLPMDSIVATTTFEEAEGIMYNLMGKDIKNLNIRYTGWSNGGVEQKVLTKVKVLNQLGGEKAMKSLIESAEKNGVPLYFDGLTCFAYNSGVFNGFVTFTDAARMTTREQVRIYPYSKIFYQQDDFYDPFYLVKPAYAKQNATNLINKLGDMGAAGVAFRDIGYLLSADYNQNETVTREQVKQMNIDTMLEAKAAGEKVMIKEGYDYAMPYADFISNMDLNGIEYSILDKTVPFYQIAIHGAVDYTGLPINTQSDWQTELLRCAEYGAGLNFTFMAADGKVLQDTLHTGYYGASYPSWQEDAEQIITDYQTAMAGLNRQTITGHEAVTSDVAVTTYANGQKVYVNYSMEDYRVGSVTVPARSYVVTGGESK